MSDTNPSANDILSLINDVVKSGKQIEDLLDFNPSRRTWKLKRKYLLSAEALEQRRKAAKMPRRTDISKGNTYFELMQQALKLKEGVNNLIGKVRYLHKRGNGSREV